MYSKIRLTLLCYRLGSSEVQQVQSVIDGVELMIKCEKALEAGTLEGT